MTKPLLGSMIASKMSLLVQSSIEGLLDRVFKEKGKMRTGNNLQFHCPFCRHRKRKMEVCLDEPYAWHCWVCDSKGKGLSHLLNKMNCSAVVKDELRKLNLNENAHVVKKEVDPSEVPPLLLPEGFHSLTYNDGSREYRQAVQYAKKRKITPFDIIKHNIGYCTVGRYRDRLIFPSYDKNNNLNFFTGRSYYDDVYLKYDNCDASKNIIGFENMVDFNYPIFLCEGPIDAISLRRNAIPLYGKTMSKALKIALIENPVPLVYIVLDDDALDGALRIADFLSRYGRTAKLVNLKGKDPNVIGFVKSIEQSRETENLDFAANIRLKLGIRK